MQFTKSTKTSITAGFFLAVAAASLWSFIGPLSKGILTIGISPLETAFWRALLGGVCFFVQAALFRKLFIPIRDASKFFLFGFLGIGVLFGTLQVAIHMSGAATAMILMYTAPIWVALAARFFFHEKISVWKIFAIFIALAGTALICISGGSISSEYSSLGIFCGLISGIAYASHFPFFMWWRKRYSIETIYTYILLGGAVSLYPTVSFSPLKTFDTWVWIIALAFLTTYLAYIAFAESLKRISQIQAAIIGNIEPLLSTLWVWMLFDENFNDYGWLGVALIAIAVFLLTVKGNTTFKSTKYHNAAH